MDPFAVSYFSDRALLHDLKALVARDHRTTALLLTRLAEVDERKLYLRVGYPSLYEYCLHEVHWCEGTACRRIYAARAARRFPVLFDAVADGRLHLTAVLMLSKYLTSGNVDELLAAATHKSKAEIERLIVERFPQPDLPEVVRAIAPPPAAPTAIAPPEQHSPENAGAAIPPVHPPALGPTQPATTRPRPPRSCSSPRHIPAAVKRGAGAGRGPLHVRQRPWPALRGA